MGSFHTLLVRKKSLTTKLSLLHVVNGLQELGLDNQRSSKQLIRTPFHVLENPKVVTLVEYLLTNFYDPLNGSLVS